MFDYLLGLVMLGLGIQTPIHANVLGDQTTATASAIYPSGQPSEAGATGQLNPRPTLRLLRPVLTKAEEDAFQKERQLRMAKLRPVTEARLTGIQRQFFTVLQQKRDHDLPAATAYLHTVQAFTDTAKKQKFFDTGDRYELAVTSILSVLQLKLESMSDLLDRMTAAEAALHTQGKDVSKLDSDITAAQAKVATAFTLSQNVAGSVPSTLMLAGEASAGAQIRTQIVSFQSAIKPLYAAFTSARLAVGAALADLESMTVPVDVTPTP